MKKIIFALIALFAVTFSSCDKNEVSTNPTKYTDEEILQHVKFVGQGNSFVKSLAPAIQKSPNGSITIITATLGRKSKNCKGFGICSVQIGPWTIYNEAIIDNDSNVVILPYNGEESLNEIKLLLAEQPGIDMRHVTLSIDEDITIVNETNVLLEGETISAGEYAFKPELGEYGGFELATLQE